MWIVSTKVGASKRVSAADRVAERFGRGDEAGGRSSEDEPGSGAELWTAVGTEDCAGWTVEGLGMLVGTVSLLADAERSAGAVDNVRCSPAGIDETSKLYRVFMGCFHAKKVCCAIIINRVV